MSNTWYIVDGRPGVGGPPGVYTFYCASSELGNPRLRALERNRRGALRLPLLATGGPTQQ